MIHLVCKHPLLGKIFEEVNISFQSTWICFQTYFDWKLFLCFRWDLNHIYNLKSLVQRINTKFHSNKCQTPDWCPQDCTKTRSYNLTLAIKDKSMNLEGYKQDNKHISSLQIIWKCHLEKLWDNNRFYLQQFTRSKCI